MENDRLETDLFHERLTERAVKYYIYVKAILLIYGIYDFVLLVWYYFLRSFH